MHYLILGGAGMMGSGTVRDLLSPLSEGVTKVTVTDISTQRLSKLSEDLDDERLVSSTLDVTNAEATMQLIASADICINAVPTFAGHQMEIFDYCLQANRPYVDYGGMGVYTVKQKKHHDQWKKAGLTAVLGLGADPGMSNLLCKAVAERLDTIDKINLYWAATLIGTENPVLVPPYSISTILAEYGNCSQQFLDGKLQEVPPLSGQETLQLPEPWGETEFMYTQHSEPSTVPFATGIAEKGIQEMTWKLAFPKAEHEAWVGLVKAGFGDFEDPININGVDIEPLQFLEKVIDRNIERRKATIPEQEGHEIHLAIGKGTHNGMASEAKCMVLSGPDPLYDNYIDAGTSMNVSIGAQLIANAPAKPGVWGPEEYFDLERYFVELRKRKFHIKIESTVFA